MSHLIHIIASERQDTCRTCGLATSHPTTQYNNINSPDGRNYFNTNLNEQETLLEINWTVCWGLFIVCRASWSTSLWEHVPVSLVAIVFTSLPLYHCSLKSREHLGLPFDPIRVKGERVWLCCSGAHIWSLSIYFFTLRQWQPIGNPCGSSFPGIRSIDYVFG